MFADLAPAGNLGPRSTRPPFLARAVRSGWFDRRRAFVALLASLALLPVIFVLTRGAQAALNVVYWDEIETALALVLRLDHGVTPGQFLDSIFAITNEHRMVTSRLLYATSYWLTGTVNFSVIAWLGNASLVGLCVLLIATAGPVERRLRLGVLLAFLLFQLEHYENFLWSGASIDHFQVVLLAAAAIVGVSLGTRRALLTGALFALLATFTLAHGLLAWPIGAAMLAQARRWRHFALWAVFAAAGLGGFAIGFYLNPGERFASLSFEGLVAIGHFWLMLLGAVPALANEQLSPWLGAALLVGLGWLIRRGAPRREPIALPLACFAIAALGLIAVGRAEESGGVVQSRYLVLGGLAWALALFMACERYSHPRRPLVLLGRAAPLLIAFNVAADYEFSPQADSWEECRNRAALRYKQHGVDGQGVFQLYPVPARSTALLEEAERLGVYRMGSVCVPRSFPRAQRSERIRYFVDEMTVSQRSAFLFGWAAVPGERARRGQVHVVLRGEDGRMHIFTAVAISRPDVATATNEPGWTMAGFGFARSRDRLPTGEFQVGFLIADGKHAEYTMTAHKLRLVGDGEAQLATD